MSFPLHERRATPNSNICTNMNEDTIAKLNASIRDVMDFPKPGIVFKDITPMLGDAEMLRLSIDALEATMDGKTVDKIVALDARGFLFGGALAVRIGAGLVPIRKKGKLPHDTEAVSYELEYGSATVEIHADAIKPGERIWIIDDVLATGGTAAAAAALVSKLGGKLLGMSFLLELGFLQGRRNLPESVAIKSVLLY